MSDGALSDVKVLDLTHYIAGPYCTKLLADYGADVIKVERPETGDGSRRLGPFPGDVPHPEKSGLFLHLNTNKRGITLDLKSEAGRVIALSLAAGVDIVVESFRPGTMDRLGLGYEVLREANPNVVLTSISNFGQTGPYRDYLGSEIVFYGMGGQMIGTGVKEREPLKLGGSVSQYQAGSTAAAAAMGAFYGARYQGTGQHVDVSIMESLMGSIDRRMTYLLVYQYTGEISQRQAMEGSANYPYGVFPCREGYLQISGQGNYFRRSVKMLGSPEFLIDPRWYAPGAQTDPDLREEFYEYFIGWCLERTATEAWHAAQEAGVLSAPLNTTRELAVDPHFNGRNAFTEIEHPDAGLLKYPGRPFIMGETPWSVRRPAPRLGEHNAEVLTALGYSEADMTRLKQARVI